MLDKEKVNSILYIEDEEDTQKQLSRFLKRFCKNLYIASDGIDGITQYKKYNPDFIISDINMPNMNGIEMCHKIREINSEIPIIFTTAFSDIEYFQEAIELQVEGYLFKPIDLDLVEKKVKSVIKQIKLKEELINKEKLLIQQSKMASMGEMISNIAHQWKQPLSVISIHVTNLQLLVQMQENISKDVLESCSEGVLTQTKYLSDTIDDFRGFLKPSIDKLDVSFNLKDFIEKCIKLIEASFEDNMISIIKDIDLKINSTGSHNHLLQAIVNILNNAKDALKDISETQEKLVFIMTAKEDDENNILISIKDNAGGVPEDIIDKIFEPYFTTKGNVLGTGLGLFITYEIITKQFNGSIWVENEEYEYEGVRYKGAKFILKIPINKKDE